MAGFGFTPPEDSNDPDRKEPSENQPGNFSDIFQQFSSMGLNIQSLISSLSGQRSPAALSQEMIRDISRKFLSAHGELPLSISDLAATKEALDIADLWINEATAFIPIPVLENCALSRRDWIDSTLTGWQEIAGPLVEGMSDAMSAMLKDNLGDGSIPLGDLNIPGLSAAGMAIPQPVLASILATFMSSLISSQLGQTIGNLSASVTGANDVALPLSSEIKVGLIPQNVAIWGANLEIDESEIRIYLALREIAAARLFAAKPWLREYIKNSIATYGKGIRVDITAMTEQAEEAMRVGELDPANPESLTLALSGGLFTPEETPAQRIALEKLETVLALIEGWIDSVVALAAKDRLPSLTRLRETQQRRRATKSPTQELFAALVGLEVSPRRTREAIKFWEKIVDISDTKSRDEIWDEAFLLPSADQLSDPERFLRERTVPDDLSGLI